MANASVVTNRVLRLSTPMGTSLNTDIVMRAGKLKMECIASIDKGRIAYAPRCEAFLFYYHGS